jgi:hypothetical protein
MPEGSAASAIYVYVDTALGGLNRRNHVRPLREVDFKDTGAERYISHRRGSIALVDWTRTHTNASGNPTIEGFDGDVWDASLPFDFDARGNPAQALEWVRQFFSRLEQQEVPLDAVRVCFSGAKGFHVEIPHTLFGGFEPNAELHVWERRAALELMHGIPFDTAVYDKLRLWRLTNTLNAKGQYYKVQLSVSEVCGLSMDEILALASTPRARLTSAPDAEWAPNDYLVGVWQRARGIAEPAPESLTSGFSPLKPEKPENRPSDERRDHAIGVASVGLIASHWPTDVTLSRHSDYLLPLSGFLTQQMDAEQAAALLKEAALQAGDQSFLEDRTRHWQDEIDRLTMNSAAKIANNQPVEGLPTVARHWPELADLLSTLFVVRIRPNAKPSSKMSQGFVFTLTKDMLAEPIEITPYVVEGMLPAGGISLWGAKPKVGKSVAARNLALSVARGEPFLGRACKQGPVLMLALEEKRAEVTGHFRSMGVNEESIHVHTGKAPDTSKAGIAALTAAIAVYQPLLVVVDPVFKLVRVKDSSDYAELTRELEPVIELARNTGCHIAVTHHLGKMERDGGDDVLGSTAIFGAVDTLVIMRKNQKTGMRILQTVQRYGKDLPETSVPMDEVTGRVTLGSDISEIQMLEARKAVIELLVQVGPGGVDQQYIRKEAGVASQHAGQALMRLHKEQLVERTGLGRSGDPYVYRLAEGAETRSGFLVFSTSREKQEIRPILNSNEGDPAEVAKSKTLGPCRACGEPLSDAEAQAGLGLHWDCAAPCGTAS